MAGAVPGRPVATTRCIASSYRACTDPSRSRGYSAVTRQVTVGGVKEFEGEPAAIVQLPRRSSTPRMPQRAGASYVGYLSAWGASATPPSMWRSSSRSI